MGFDPIRFDRLQQRPLKPFPLAHTLIHAFLEEAHRRAMFRLGSIKGNICLTERFARRCGVTGQERNPNARSDGMFDAIDHDWLRQRLNNSRRDRGSTFRAEDMWREDDEFVTSQSCDQVLRPNSPEKSLRDDDERLIPDRMAIAVVDLLEAVQVEHQDGMGRTGSRR